MMGSLGNMDNLLGTANSRAAEATPIRKTRERAKPVRPAPVPTAVPEPKAEPTPTNNSGGAAYLDYERIEARLTGEQIADLDGLARQLNSRRVDKSTPRITKNTLIRVAADLLLDRRGELTGDTEDALRRSLG